MTYQPKLCEKLVSFGRLDFCISHSCDYVDVAYQPVDGTHIHGCYEVYFNLSGDVSFLHGASVFRVLPGDVILSFPGDVHCCIYNTPTTHDHFCLWFDEGTVGEYLIRCGARGLIRLSREQKERLKTLVFRIDGSETDPFVRSACFSELISLLGQRESEREESTEIPEKLNSILAYVDERFVSISTSREIAEKFFISEPTLNRLFRKYVGLSVHKLIEAKRLSFAENLIKEGRSVTEACYRAGFTDCSRFISRFKEKFGVTPLKYKFAFLNKIPD